MQNTRDREQWDKVKEIVGQVLDCDPTRRMAFLNEVCGSDATLRAEVESLVAAYENASRLFQDPFPAVALETAAPSDEIGRYRLVRKLGEGGMGQVWLAEQMAPVQRQVALKLVRAALSDESLLRRFQAERQSLAIMDHPAIAKVFDAGTTTGGQPYFVMEYVQGTPINAYCDQHHLEIRDRLELFIKVCEGVQHAHQKAIIHRDLKPANILVVEADDEPMPRIIDFGLAKLVAPAATGETMFTQIGGFVGTPAYVSPEQADPGVHDIDTRTDVYSLGAVLYELMTGSTPFDPKGWPVLPLHEILRQLREQDPPRPSTRVKTDQGSSTKAAALRGTQPKLLVSLLRGDLDWITMKALEKDRNRRYGTPTELASDIRRFLNHEPILARPANPGYRLQKYVRRHRLGVGVTTGLVLLLAGFAVLQAVQLRRITRERDRADRIARFMTDIFKVADPEQKFGETPTARDVLDKATQDIDTGLSHDPEMKASLLHVMALAYINLGLFSRAQALLERSIQLSASTLGPDNLQTLKSRHKLAWTFFQQGRLADAESQQRSLIEVERRVLGPEDEETIGTMGDLATTLAVERRLPEAEKIQQEVLKVQKRVLGPEAHYTLISMDNLAFILLDEGRPEEAEKLAKETLEIQRRVYGSNDFNTIHFMMNEAEIKAHTADFKEAERMSLDLLDLERRVNGPDSPEAAETTYSLATMKAREGKTDEALSLLQHAVDHGMFPRQALGLSDDPDLSVLHGDPRFAALVVHAKEVAASKGPR